MFINLLIITVRSGFKSSTPNNSYIITKNTKVTLLSLKKIICLINYCSFLWYDEYISPENLEIKASSKKVFIFILAKIILWKARWPWYYDFCTPLWSPHSDIEDDVARQPMINLEKVKPQLKWVHLVPSNPPFLLQFISIPSCYGTTYGANNINKNSLLIL